MAKPEYRILKDRPTNDAYGQYYYSSDTDDFLINTGMTTLDPFDDLYTTIQSSYEVDGPNPFSYGFDGLYDDETAKIEMEVYRLSIELPFTSTIWIDWDQRLYIVEGNYDNIIDGISDYSDFNSWLNMGSRTPFLRFTENFDNQADYTGCAVVGYMITEQYLNVSTGWRIDTPDGDPAPPDGAWTRWGGAGCNSNNYDCNIAIDYTNWTNFTDASTWQDYIYNDTQDLMIVWYGHEKSTDISGQNLHNSKSFGIYRLPKSEIFNAWLSGEEVIFDLCMGAVYSNGEGYCCGSCNWYGNDDMGANPFMTLGSYWGGTGDDTPVTCPDVPGDSNVRPMLRLRIKPPTAEVFEIPEWQFFYNMGGQTLEEYFSIEHPNGFSPELGGYNIHYDVELFPDEYTFLFNHIYDDWRPISNIFTNVYENVDDNIFIQLYYGYGSEEYLFSSAPTEVGLYFDIADSTDIFDINYIDYFNNVANHYISYGANPSLTGELLYNDFQSHAQPLKFFVVNWDYRDGDEDFSDVVFPNSLEEIEFLKITENIYDVIDVIDLTNQFSNILYNQYESPGIKHIKVVVFSTITDDLNKELALVVKTVDIKINLGLDDVYIEDFTEVGGPDFVFIPWPSPGNWPIIGGIDDNSKYIQSLKKVINGDNFLESEYIEKTYAEKALLNDNIGVSLGNVDMEQTRCFVDGTYDLGKLLGIESAYMNIQNYKGDNIFYPHSDSFYWDGIVNFFSKETSVGSIFIYENLDSDLLSSCIFEFNYGESDFSKVRDFSGNGNVGIFIGDYSISKQNKNIQLRRDATMKIPKIDNKDRAI